ncbi:hypothetical protein Rhe02_65280 [Rhizocola hellebori]|uniref:Uncharacterized protein n=1 Tax=Rhizocola hellebori TaxID=1392758 RepID=A0A8J3QD45_9ACTN|nr:hypothetical protein Rhe02_65280 [Rhizocola hellebori]
MARAESERLVFSAAIRQKARTAATSAAVAWRRVIDMTAIMAAPGRPGPQAIPACGSGQAAVGDPGLLHFVLRATIWMPLK